MAQRIGSCAHLLLTVPPGRSLVLTLTAKHFNNFGFSVSMNSAGDRVVFYSKIKNNFILFRMHLAQILMGKHIFCLIIAGIGNGDGNREQPRVTFITYNWAVMFNGDLDVSWAQILMAEDVE